MESGKDKVKKICEAIRKEAMDPAVIEADTIIDGAKAQAEEILAKARFDAEEILLKSKKEIEQEKSIFKASIHQAVKQTLEELKQKIEKQFFKEDLASRIQKETSDPKVIANLINAIVKALEKEGTSANLSAIIPETVSPRAVNELLLKEVIGHLGQKGVEVGEIQGGVVMKMLDEKISLEVTNEVLRSLVANFIRKDFRDYLFNA